MPGESIKMIANHYINDRTEGNCDNGLNSENYYVRITVKI